MISLGQRQGILPYWQPPFETQNTMTHNAGFFVRELKRMVIAMKAMQVFDQSIRRYLQKKRGESQINPLCC